MSQHLRFYGHANFIHGLVRLLERAGWQVVDYSYIGRGVLWKIGLKRSTACPLDETWKSQVIIKGDGPPGRA